MTKTKGGGWLDTWEAETEERRTLAPPPSTPAEHIVTGRSTSAAIAEPPRCPNVPGRYCRNQPGEECDRRVCAHELEAARIDFAIRFGREL